MDSTGNISCLMQNEAFNFDSPPFIDTVSYVVTDTIVPALSYSETFTVDYLAVTYVPFCSTTETDEITAKDIDIIIAPNPFNFQTTIIFSTEQKNTIIKIIDLLGKEIRTINFTGRELIIDKREMKEGIYFVQTISETKSVGNKKIIIQ